MKKISIKGKTHWNYDIFQVNKLLNWNIYGVEQIIPIQKIEKSCHNKKNALDSII